MQNRKGVLRAVAVLALVAVPLLSAARNPQVDGRKIFTGKGLCATCHGPDGKGTPLAPNLTDTEWLNVDGTLAQVDSLIRVGVPKPKQHPAPMPPMGGARLSDEEVKAVAAYVVSLSRPRE